MILLDALLYVVTAPYFWPSMGFTTATAMFVGVLLHDGNLRQVAKAEVTILTFAIFLIVTTVPRVASHNISAQHLPGALGGLTTIICVTFFYTLGLLLGVLIAYKRAGESTRSKHARM